MSDSDQNLIRNVREHACRGEEFSPSHPNAIESSNVESTNRAVRSLHPTIPHVRTFQVTPPIATIMPSGRSSVLERYIQRLQENEYRSQMTPELEAAMKMSAAERRTNDSKDTGRIKPAKPTVVVIATNKITPEMLRTQPCCPCCLRDFSIDEEVADLNCLHFFHIECIEVWLKSNDTCPMCRAVIPSR